MPTLQPPWLRFVVLRHEGIPQPHFDLMFETAPNSALATWRSPIWPIDSQTALQHLQDHRAAYLQYEGPISAARGFVRRITAGRHRIHRNDSALLVVELEDGTVYHLRKSEEAKNELLNRK